MPSNKKDRLIYLRSQLSLAVFLLIVLLVSGFFIFGPDLTKMALALSSNYAKTTGQSLDTATWNNLPADFLARTGGAGSAMQGALDMGNNKISNLAAPTADSDAATKKIVDNKVTNTTGTGLKMVCGTENISLVNTTQYGSLDKSHIRVTVNTASAGFAATPVYFSSLQGSYSFLSHGVEDVYPSGTNQLSLVITFIGEDRNGKLTGTGAAGTYLTPSQAASWNWKINWCGIGN